MRGYLTQIRTNLRLTMRDRTVLFFNYMFPLLFFFIFGFLMHAEQGGAIVQIVNMVLVIGILGSGFFGAGMRTVMDREANILRRFKVAPISAGPILVSQMVVGLVHYIPVTVLILTLAHFVYGMPPPEHPGSLFLFVMIGVTAFRAMGGIIGAVANSMQESQIIIQLLYFPMLFLGGATFPLAAMPNWLQIVAQFVPTTYLSTGITAILQGHETIWNNLAPAGALLLTAVVGTFLALKLFRWEKEEKMRTTAKLWLIAVLAPFIAMGAWQAHSKDNVVKGKILAREMSRSRTLLIRDARLFLGDGNVIEQGAVLVKNGKIADIYAGAAPDAKTLKAEAIDAAGKTLLPGLIDVHVRLATPGGFSGSGETLPRELTAYLYSGVTAVQSDGNDDVFKAREIQASGETLGAELFVAAPVLASQRMSDLPGKHLNAIKVVLPMDSSLLKAIVEQAHKFKLSVACHVGDSLNIEEAVNAGVDNIEAGSIHDLIPDALFAKMKQAGIAYDPELDTMDTLTMIAQGKFEMLDRTLVQQVTPRDLLESTGRFLRSPAGKNMRAGILTTPAAVNISHRNLLAAMRAGVTLVTGTDSGDPGIFHGPAVHRELQLWVEAGVPAAVALQAATYNGAQLLRTSDRMGVIKKGYQANLLLVDGNPLKDISVTERISMVVLQGERINRSELFDRQ